MHLDLVDKRKIIKRTFTMIPLTILAFTIITSLGSSPLFFLFRINSPTEGVTRALLAAFSFDFQASVEYHPFAIPIFLVFIFSFYHELLPIKKATVNFVFITTGVIVFIFHIFRLLA